MPLTSEMRASELRNQVIAMAEHDPSMAIKLAREINDPWYRTQALAHVARYEAEDSVFPVAREAFSAAADCDDPYNVIAVAAWPLRAMIERGQHEAARRELAQLLAHSPKIEPDASRSEALFFLFQAAFAYQDEIQKIGRMLYDLANKQFSHWRTRRNLVDALLMLRAIDNALAFSLATGIADEKMRAKTLRKLKTSPPMSPRAFF